ncbi:MAG: acetate/propionate family kinase [Gemmataceae bacterium]
MSILVINAGSSSLKFGLFDDEALRTLATGLIDWRRDPRQAELVIHPEDGDPIRARESVADHRAAVLHAVNKLADLSGPNGGATDAITVVGHRVVHGGARFQEAVRIDADVKAEIAKLAELAPLHNPPALEALEAAESALPNVPQVAAFDTSFFTSLEPRAYVYPAPYSWYTDWGIRRFGFHGISHAYCAGRAAELLGRPLSESRLIVCHLGNGCSASAIRAGRAVQTSMGYTPLEGLMMGTRSGSLGVGALLHVQRRWGVSAEQMDQVLNHESGLLGVSGVSSDYRQVKTAADRGNERARLALAMFADRIRATIGAYAVTLGGIDAVVFTAGIGEHAADLRAAVCEGLHILGLRLDSGGNASGIPDADVAAADSIGRILVLRTREELMIARETRRVMSASA